MSWHKGRNGVLFAVLVLGLGGIAVADPCGMVPPVSVGNNVTIARVGDQQTYVFFKNGVETIVIRPGFEGKVEEFGMLIPFPTVPELRKVSDHIFPHIAAAVDPPEVVINLRLRMLARNAAGFGGGGRPQASAVMDSFALKKDEVRVLKEEAVGMYEVAVLEAGSSKALKKWVDEHGYQYPKGMDAACDDYVNLGWCFVAVKTKVGQKAGVNPRPGQRQVNSKLPAGATFDGHVQVMGFRFRIEELIVPMRLSTFNKGDLHNIVYLLSDQPSKIRSVPEEYVMRQISGKQLLRNVTQPLPLRIIGGTVKDLQVWQKKNLKQRRNPLPHNGAARDLFASDLLAVKKNRLSHPHEEREKMLLQIGERLSLRGTGIDKLNESSLKEARDKITTQALSDLKGMTLTVIDGNFPREVLANQNLKFSPYQIPARRNQSELYDAKTKGPTAKQQGTVFYGTVSALDSNSQNKTQVENKISSRSVHAGWMTAISCLLIGLAVAVHRRKGLRGLLLFASVLAIGGVSLAGEKKVETPGTLELIDRLSDPKQAEEAADALILRGKMVVPDLIGEAFEGRDMVLRGWAIVCLSEIGGAEVERRLTELHNDAKQPPLVRTWAAAGRVRMTDSNEKLLKLATLIPQFPALGRPVGMKLVANLSKKGDDVSAEDLLSVTLTVPQLQASLAPAILALGSDSLVKAMTKSKNQNVRRQAAGYLGTLANEGEPGVPKAVVRAYEFDVKSAKVPWDGGPLFIPALKWSKTDARELVGNLVRWHLWCERKTTGVTRTALQRQLHNNLRSLQLASAAGYRSPGFQEVRTNQWLLVWGRAVGKNELKDLLEEQNVAGKAPYKQLLGQLE